MTSPSSSLFLSLLLLSFVLFCNRMVESADEAQNLFQQINTYRASLNLTTLQENDNAKCLASGLAAQFKDQPCTNTTGSNTVPGTEPQFSGYPELLSKCHLNVTVTRDGEILPACVPNLSPALVLSNYTQTQYAALLNDTRYTGAGIGSANDWIVVVLTTNTPEGSFVPASSEANFVSKLGLSYFTSFLALCSLILWRAN